MEIIAGKLNNTSRTSEYLDNLVPTSRKIFFIKFFFHQWKLIMVNFDDIQQDRAEELFEANLLLNGNLEANVGDEMFKVVHVGLFCTQRLPSMATALKMLSRRDDELPSPTFPPFIHGMEEKNSWRR